MALATVEQISGLWAVDVALLDSRDRELPFYATTSFEMKAGGTCSVQTPVVTHSTLETTQGQIDGFFSQLPFRCYLPEVASVGDRHKICPWVASRVVCGINPGRDPSACALMDGGLLAALGGSTERRGRLLSARTRE